MPGSNPWSDAAWLWSDRDGAARHSPTGPATGTSADRPADPCARDLPRVARVGLSVANRSAENVTSSGLSRPDEPRTALSRANFSGTNFSGTDLSRSARSVANGRGATSLAASDAAFIRYPSDRLSSGAGGESQPLRPSE
ncbi:pentapeptide repeat-containing protein [Algimonas porphyrae]|uniref:pentapeptide repeat-containing protein n=1 Tax=Algimonas porphyrae TaxID=1128113 RepID=UPI003529DECD